MTTTDQILDLVHLALDEFDDRQLDVTIHRTIRIANLLGDSQTAIRLGLELKPMGGAPAANAADVRRLLADPETWGDPNGPAEQAITEYIGDRTIKAPTEDHPLDGKVLSHSVGDLTFWDTEFIRLAGGVANESNESLVMRLAGHQALSRAKHRCFTSLCQWERQLTYANTNERIFTRFQSHVDALLASGTPDVLQRFSSVFRRLRESAELDPSQEVGDELSQAMASCRRILESVVDHVHPPDQPASLPDGTQADPSQ